MPRDREEVIPVVGMGVTSIVGSDRYPYTIIQIKSKTRILVQRDDYKAKEGSDYYGTQIYDYTENKEGAIVELVKCKHGWKRLKGIIYFSLGNRRAYFDPSF